MWVYSEFWACYRPFQSSSSYAVHLLRPPVSLCLTLPSLPSQLEEKARLEAEARARGHLHLREEQRRRADDERLTEELQRKSPFSHIICKYFLQLIGFFFSVCL